jgi:uncharacterized membrane protein
MATLAPFFDAPLAVQIHVIAALECVVLTPFVLLRRRRDWLHRAMGRVWVTNMAITAISSFFIMELRVVGPFSPIHALSLFTLWSLWEALRLIRLRNIEGHRKALGALTFWGLGVAGILAFLPGRRSSDALFAEAPLAGFVLVAVVVVVAALAIRRTAQNRGVFA